MPETRLKPLVVLASRETGELEKLEVALYSAGYRVVTARNEHQTLDRVRSHQPDAVVLDRELTKTYDLCQIFSPIDSAPAPSVPSSMHCSDQSCGKTMSPLVHGFARLSHACHCEIVPQVLREIRRGSHERARGLVQ